MNLKLSQFVIVMLASGLLAACGASIKGLSSNKVVVQSTSWGHTVTANIQEKADNGCARFGKKAEYVDMSHNDIYHDFLFLCKFDASQLNQLSIGMPKTRVIELLGEPESTHAASGVEYLIYYTYFVRIIDDKVDAYGRQGDFDSTKMPTQILDHNITINSSRE